MSDKVEHGKTKSIDSTKDSAEKESASKLLQEFLDQKSSMGAASSKTGDYRGSGSTSYTLPDLTLDAGRKHSDIQPSTGNPNDSSPKQGSSGDPSAKPGSPGDSKNSDPPHPPNEFRAGDTVYSVLLRMGKNPEQAKELADHLEKQAGQHSFRPGDCIITKKDGSVSVIPDSDLDKAIKGCLRTHDGKQPDYASLVKPDSRVVFSENTTHLLSPDGPKDLMKLMDQLSKANPPAKALGLEMFPTDMQQDIDNWMKNPNGTGKDGKPWEKVVQDDVKAVVEKEIGGNQSDAVQKAAAKAGKTPEEYLTDQLMSVLKEAQKDQMRVVCLDVPDSITKVTTAPPGVQSPLVSALSSIVDMKDQQKGNGLLDLYQHGNPQQQKEARQELLDFLTKKSPSKDGTDADHQKEAKEILTAMDAMKKLGFDFSSSSKDLPLDRNGKLDINRLSEYLMVGFRSKAMSEVAANALKNMPDKERMIVSVGGAHVGFDDPGSVYGEPDPTMSDILKKQYGYDSTSFEFNNDSSHPTSEIDPQLYQGYLHDDPQHKPFVVRLDQLPPYSKGHSRPFDYYVQLGPDGN